MKSNGKLFFLAALSGAVALLSFADRAWAPGYCGDGWVNPVIGEECEVDIPCLDPGDTCDEATCLCSPPSPYCGDGELNQSSEECEVGIPCADPEWSCDEITCLCSPPEPVCGDGVVNQAWEECEVDVPCADPGDTCDEAACLCSPPLGDDGCTPGFWKNHVESWPPTGYSPADDFDSTFGVDFFDPDITLYDAVWAKGGGVNRLARHATAALLSAAHPSVDYPLSIAEVIAATQAGDADLLVWYNELGCPIN